MNRNKIILAAVLVMIFIITCTASFFLYPTNNAISTISGGNNPVLLGNTSEGSVIKVGPYGNQSSPVKIAYIIGVHPLEVKAHQAIFESIVSDDRDLQYCYYIYIINVTRNADNYDKGRLNGQILANKYAVPDIISQKFDLAIDIHSNVGNWKENQFIFSPVKGSASEDIAMKIKQEIPWLTYYVPPNPTSTSYVTIPLIKAGIPAIIYETYVKDPDKTIKQHAEEFISTVDELRY
jgi:hypothetical protein